MKLKWKGPGNITVDGQLLPPGSVVDLPEGLVADLDESVASKLEPVKAAKPAEPVVAPKRRGRKPKADKE